MAVIPLLMVGRMGLLTALVAPTAAGATQLVMTPPTQVEVAAAVIDGSQPGTIAAALEAPARPVPSAAQATAPGAGRTEGDAAKGSLGVVVLGEGSTSAPLTSSVVGGGVLVGTSR